MSTWPSSDQKRRILTKAPVDEVIVDINAICSLVFRHRQGLIAASEHYVNNYVGVSGVYIPNFIGINIIIYSAFYKKNTKNGIQ